MINARVEEVEHIQSSGRKAVLAFSGGGAKLISALMCQAGASRFVLEIQMPYSNASLENFLGGPLESAASAETARRMAERALERATQLGAGEQSLGIACTAALQTRYKRSGNDRAHLCMRSAEKMTEDYLALRGCSRGAQEEELCDFVLGAIREFVA